MRTAFVNTLVAMARKNKDIFLLTGDLGFSVLEKFQDEFPDRFFNVGVAEQNMMGIAAGLALSGKIVFIYSIVPFVTMRCYEQIRNDVCQQNLKVRIIGIGGGLCYGSAGRTHHSIEDIAIMRPLSNMSIICPADSTAVKFAVREAIKYSGPIYMRLGKGAEPAVYNKAIDFKIGKAILLKRGRDVTLIATGNILCEIKIAAEKLEHYGFSIRLVDMHTIKPLDKNAILEAAKKSKAIFTVEEHSVIGGLGSAVSEVLIETGYKGMFKKIAIPEDFIDDTGSHEYLRKRNRICEEYIVKTVIANCKMSKGSI